MTRKKLLVVGLSWNILGVARRVNGVEGRKNMPNAFGLGNTTKARFFKVPPTFLTLYLLFTMLRAL